MNARLHPALAPAILPMLPATSVVHKVLATSTCTRGACTTDCAYPFCFDKQPVSERAALQVDLDILAGKLDGRFQARRDDRAVREQQQRLGQIGELK